MYDYEEHPQIVCTVSVFFKERVQADKQIPFRPSSTRQPWPFFAPAQQSRISYSHRLSYLNDLRARVTDGCDGLLIATPQAIETPETLASLLRYYEGKVYAIGPLFATGTEAGALEKSKSEDSDRIIALMDRVLESRGPRSLVYVTSLFLRL